MAQLLESRLLPIGSISQVCPLMGQSLICLSEHPNFKHRHQIMLVTVGLAVLEFVHRPSDKLSLKSVPGALNYHNTLVDQFCKGTNQNYLSPSVSFLLSYHCLHYPPQKTPES